MLLVIGPGALLLITMLLFRPLRILLFYAVVFFGIVWFNAVYHVLAPGVSGFVALGVVTVMILVRCLGGK